MSLPDTKISPLLEAYQAPHQTFCFLELDNTPQLADLLGLDIVVEANVVFLTQVTRQIALVAQEFVSALVLDPVYSFSVTENFVKIPALFLRLEHLAEEIDPLAVPTMIHNWGIENIKNNYAAAKLELLYHPREQKALEKKQLLAEIYDYCRYERIPFLLKLIVYTPAGETFDPVLFQEAQMEAIQELRNSCNVLSLQYPQDALASATVTAELDIPWILTAQGVEYDVFKETLRTSLENGARGFQAGGVLWQEIGRLKKSDESPDKEGINRFLETTFRDRLIEVTRIVQEAYVENS